MYQPSGSRNVGKWTHVPATISSNVREPNNNSHLTTNSRIGTIRSANSYLPPPPSYFSSHVVNTRVQAEPMYLSNWCVNVKNIRLEQGDTGLIAELSGK